MLADRQICAIPTTGGGDTSRRTHHRAPRRRERNGGVSIAVARPRAYARSGPRPLRRRSTWLLLSPRTSSGSARVAWLLLPRSSSYALTTAIGLKQARAPAGGDQSTWPRYGSSRTCSVTYAARRCCTRLPQPHSASSASRTNARTPLLSRPDAPTSRTPASRRRPPPRAASGPARAIAQKQAPAADGPVLMLCQGLRGGSPLFALSRWTSSNVDATLLLGREAEDLVAAVASSECGTP